MAASAKNLADLQQLREALVRQREEAEARAARERAEREARERERRFFADAVGPVNRLPMSTRHHAPLVRPAPEPRQRHLDEQDALRATREDDLDHESLLLTDDGLSHRRPEVPPEVVLRLRRGEWAIQAEIDLHGLRRDEAKERLAEFIRATARRGQRCVRVVHGKGMGSPGKEPVLKGKVQRWLAKCREVIAFTQARGADGGAGALIVLLDA